MWTAGQLRAALDGVPDEVRIRVIYDVDDDTGDDRLVVHAALDAFDAFVWCHQLRRPSRQPLGRAPARRPDQPVTNQALFSRRLLPGGLSGRREPHTGAPRCAVAAIFEGLADQFQEASASGCRPGAT